MKKSILITIMIIMIINPVFSANNISELSSEAQQKYIMNSLSIQTKEHSVATGAGFGNMIGSTTIMSSVSRGTSETEWYPYLGPNAIDRGQFYEIVGNHELSEAYENGIKRENTMHIAGWSLFAACMIGGLSTSLVGYFSTNNIVYAYVGMGIILAGLGSIPLVSWEYKDDVSISFAIGMSDIYNNRLYESLK